MGFSAIFNPLSTLLSGMFSGLGSIISAKSQAKSADKQTQMVIDAQREANAANIASQERINQSQIDNSNYINNLMRSDAHNAISIKKRDLINAGYSTADPNLQGFSTASLTQPVLSSQPMHQTTYPAELAGINNSARQSMTDALIDSSKIFSDLALKEAETRSVNANTTSTEIRNGWLDAELQVNYDTALQSLSNLRKDGLIKENDLKKFSVEMDILRNNADFLSEQIISAKTNNKYLSKKIDLELKKLSEDINLCRANVLESKARTRVALSSSKNLDADTANKIVQKSLYQLQTQLESVNLNFAKMGINFNSSGLVDAILRVASSPNGDKAVVTLLDFCSKNIDNVVKRVKSNFKLPKWLGGS